MTKSSRLSVKDSSAHATSAGLICGISTSRNICHSLAPRSLAASSCSRVKLAIRDRTTIVTKGKQKGMCAMVIVPRLDGRIGRVKRQGSVKGKGATRQVEKEG